MTSHFLVLLCLAEDPSARIVDVARRLGLTDRRVQSIIADLSDEGYVERRRVGRNNEYRVMLDRPMRHPQTRHRSVGELLGLISPTPHPN